MLLDLEFLDNILKWTNRKIEDANETAKKGGSGSAADSAMENVIADEITIVQMNFFICHPKKRIRYCPQTNDNKIGDKQK